MCLTLGKPENPVRNNLDCLKTNLREEEGFPMDGRIWDRKLGAVLFFREALFPSDRDSRQVSFKQRAPLVHLK